MNDETLRCVLEHFTEQFSQMLGEKIEQMKAGLDSALARRVEALEKRPEVAAELAKATYDTAKALEAENEELETKCSILEAAQSDRNAAHERADAAEKRCAELEHSPHRADDSTCECWECLKAIADGEARRDELIASLQRDNWDIGAKAIDRLALLEKAEKRCAELERERDEAREEATAHRKAGDLWREEIRQKAATIALLEDASKALEAQLRRDLAAARAEHMVCPTCLVRQEAPFLCSHCIEDLAGHNARARVLAVLGGKK